MPAGPVEGTFEVRIVRPFQVGITDIHTGRMSFGQFLHENVLIRELRIRLKAVQPGARHGKSPASEDILFLVPDAERIFIREDIKLRDAAVHHHRHGRGRADIRRDPRRPDQLRESGGSDHDLIRDLLHRLLRVCRHHLAAPESHGQHPQHRRGLSCVVAPQDRLHLECVRHPVIRHTEGILVNHGSLIFLILFRASRIERSERSPGKILRPLSVISRPRKDLDLPAFVDGRVPAGHHVRKRTALIDSRFKASRQRILFQHKSTVPDFGIDRKIRQGPGLKIRGRRYLFQVSLKRDLFCLSGAGPQGKRRDRGRQDPAAQRQFPFPVIHHTSSL